MTPIKHVASVAVLKDGKILMGLRRDTGKWNLPGGHVDTYEDPSAGALRELMEETNLRPVNGKVSRVGWCDLPSGIRVHSYVCAVNGEPDLSKDPDGEMHAFKWISPSAPPQSIMGNLHNQQDVTLQFLGMQPSNLPLVWDEEDGGDRESVRKVRGLFKAEGTLEKAAKEWKSPKEGFGIPVHGTPEREEWNKRYHEFANREFGGGGAYTLKPMTLHPSVLENSGSNMPVNKERLKLYTRMARGGDPLPPVVVRRSGQGYHLIDGNHRLAAALATKMPAIQVLEAVPSAKQKPQKEWEPSLASDPAPKKMRKDEKKEEPSMPPGFESFDDPPKADPPTREETHAAINAGLAAHRSETENMLAHPDPQTRMAGLERTERPEHIMPLLNDPHPEVREKALKTKNDTLRFGAPRSLQRWMGHPEFKPEDLTQALAVQGDKNMLLHPHYGTLPEHELAAAGNPKLAPIMAEKISTEQGATKLLAHGKPEYALSMLRNKNPEVKAKAIDWTINNLSRAGTSSLQEQDLSPEQVRQVLNNTSNDFERSRFVEGAKSLPPDVHEELAARHPNPLIRVAALRRIDTPAHILDHAIGDKEQQKDGWGQLALSPARAAAQHRNLSPEAQMKAVQDPDLIKHLVKADSRKDPRRPLAHLTDEVVKHGLQTEYATTFINRANLTPEAASMAANHQDPEVRAAVADKQGDKLSLADKVKLIQDPDSEVRHMMARSDYLKPEEKGELLKHVKDSASAHGLIKYYNSGIPREQEGEAAFINPHPDAQNAILQHVVDQEDLPKAKKQEFLQRALDSGKPALLRVALAHPETSHEQLEQFMPKLDPASSIPFAANPNATAHQLHQIATRFPNTGGAAAAGHPNVAPETLVHLLNNSQSSFTKQSALQNHKLPLEALRSFTQGLQAKGQSRDREEDKLLRSAEKLLQVHDPDTVFEDKVSFGLGTNKLRKIRDLVQETPEGKARHKNNFAKYGVDLTKYTKPGTAELDPAKLQQGIDSQQPLNYNVSEADWEGPQRHSTEHSKVFQLNLSTDIINKLKDAGVYNTFKRMQDASHSSGHPIHKDHGVGWVRYTQGGDPQRKDYEEDSDYAYDRDPYEERHPDEPDRPESVEPAKKGTPKDKDQFFIDEVQSDFGQSFAKQLTANEAAEARRQGQAQGLRGQELEDHVREHTARAEEVANKEFPPEDTKKINQILFHGKHSNEILYEAFLQHLRNQGHAGSRLATHSVESKAPISLGGAVDYKWVDPKTNKRVDVDEDGMALPPEKIKELYQQGKAVKVRNIPAHFIQTYEQIPQKTLGFEPATYGEGAGEEGRMKGAPTYAGKLYKFEFEISEAPEYDFLFGFTDLFKATRPEDFSSIVKATTPAGPLAVDHKGQMSAHPPSYSDTVDHYKNEVLNGPKLYKKSSKKLGPGISRKVSFKTKEGPQIGDSDTTYMVKPYHENVVKRVSSWQKFPIQGWAEMANQALYHAGGIGHLHQKVHVAEHNMGPGKEHEPALVVKISKGFKPQADAYTMVPDENQMSWATPDTQTMKRKYIQPSEKAKEDVRKIGLMDFLTNNMDRHGGNLMLSNDGDNVLAIDHSRSFQYVNTPQYKWDKARDLKQIPQMSDKFSPYIGAGTSIGHVDRYDRQGLREQTYDTDMRRLQNYAPTFEWWGQNGKKIRDTMNEQLQHIKDPEIRKHIARNFNARADWLDERARMGLENYGTDWHRDEVPHYRPGEKSEDERTEERDRARGF